MARPVGRRPALSSRQAAEIAMPADPPTYAFAEAKRLPAGKSEVNLAPRPNGRRTRSKRMRLGTAFRFLLLGCFGAAWAFNGSAAPPGPVQAAAILQTLKLPNGKCLHVDSRPPRAGANIVVTDCIEKSANQRWRFGDHGQIVNETGLCLGVAGDPRRAGSSVRLSICGSGEGSKWHRDDKSRIVNAAGLCLESQINPTAKKVPVRILECHEPPNPYQVWR